MIMLGNTKNVRTLFYVTFVALLVTTGATAQDRSPEVQYITLDDAKARAAAATSNVAQLAVDVAKYHRQAAQADYFPKLDAGFLNLHYNKFMGQSIQLFHREAAVPLFGKDETAVAFTVTQPVTQLLQVHQVVNIARADEQIAKAKGAQLTAQTAEKVAHIYFALLIAQRRQTVAEKKFEALKSESQLATTAALQVVHVMGHEAAFLEASKELVATDSEASELALSLNTLMGFDPGTKLILAVPEPTAETISLPQATQQAVANSAEVVEAEQTLAKARAASKLSKLEYLPAVAVVGGYFNQQQPVLPLLPTDSSFIGFIATFDIFDFGKREKTVSERNAQVSLAEANVAMVKQKVAASVQKSFFDLQRTQKIRDLTRLLAAGRQESTLENTSARAIAEAEMIQAELDYRSAYTQLKRLVDGR